MSLSTPECPFGYPVRQLEEELDPVEFEKLGQWLRGQTMMICAGERIECVEQPHGAVVYKWDVDRYFAGLPVID